MMTNIGPIPTARSRKVLMVAYPGIQPLDAVGPLEVFHVANTVYRQRHGRGPAPYALELVGLAPGPVPTPAGYALFAQRGYRQHRGPIDTLLVPGGSGARAQAKDVAFRRWLVRAADRSRRVCSVCTGALVLASAGLLDGKRATTHWAACDYLADHHPMVEVEADPIFVRDGRVYTSAGVLAGVDLALALVEDDLGAALSLEVARWLLVFFKRPGGQSQFSAHLAPSAQPSRPLQTLIAHMIEHPDADLSVATLAQRVGMSPRNFARRFLAEMGTTPAHYVNRVRIESARAHLQASDESLEQIAERCGFGSAETMRRAFLRAMHVSPSDYRTRFTHA